MLGSSPLLPPRQAWGRAEERVIDCPRRAILILEGFCIMKMSIRKELTQIIRFLIERNGGGCVLEKKKSNRDL